MRGARLQEKISGKPSGKWRRGRGRRRRNWRGPSKWKEAEAGLGRGGGGAGQRRRRAWVEAATADWTDDRPTADDDGWADDRAPPVPPPPPPPFSSIFLHFPEVQRHRMTRGGAIVPLLLKLKSPLLERPASVAGAVFNMSTSIVGAGIMSIPTTIKVLGVIPAFVSIAMVAILVDVSVEFIMRFTNFGESSAYAGLIYESFERFGSVAVQICILITNLGYLIIYQIIIGNRGGRGLVAATEYPIRHLSVRLADWRKTIRIRSAIRWM
ncbi:unnamed protein product [Camellia sinensis]